MSVLQAFTRAVSRLGLDTARPLGVAVSGGSDSTALVSLASRVFDNVVAFTVDHRLRKESRDEARQVQEVVQSIGAEGVVLTLDWGVDGPPSQLGKIQTLAREKRFSALLDACSSLGLSTLLLGQHRDDQAETFMCRVEMGSRIDGLACMALQTRRLSHPKVNIVRPLLEIPKSDLVHYCEEMKVPWIEDPTNKNTAYVRNHYKKVLNDCGLNKEVAELVRACGEAKYTINNQVRRELNSLPRINSQYGYLTFNHKQFITLPRSLATRVLEALIRYTLQTENIVSQKVLDRVYNSLLDYNGKALGIAQCVFFKDSDSEIGLAKKFTRELSSELVSIEIGESVVWQNSWVISLKRKNDKNPSKKQQKSFINTKTLNSIPTLPLGSLSKDEFKEKIRQFSSGLKDNTCSSSSNQSLVGGSGYYIRNMIESDWALCQKGVRNIRATRLAPTHVRSSLPVIVDHNGVVVVIPHFKYSARGCGLIGVAEYQPKHRTSDFLS